MSDNNFEKIYYFGDSLTDSGGFFALSSQLVDLNILPLAIPLELAGYDQKFSNGDVYADIAPDLFGIAPENVENFAIGGAAAVGVQTFGDNLGLPDGLGLDPALVDFDMNLGGQVDRFLEQAVVTPPPADSAASLFIGLIDLKDFAQSEHTDVEAELTALIGDIVSSTLGAAATLSAAGVGTVIINTLPPLTMFPAIETVPPELVPFVDLAVDGINAGLMAGAEALVANGVNITFVDFNALATEIVADHETFGFQSITEPFLLGTGASADVNPDALAFDVDQLGFYDLLHPTTNLHGVFGAFSEASVNSETWFGDQTDEVFRGNSSYQGDDLVFAAGGNDKVILGRGDDVAFGGTGDDKLFGKHGSDILSGGSGNDKVFGGTGDDVLAGGTGDDKLVGGSGNDGLIDGLGDDRLFGNGGDDFFFYAESVLLGGAPGDSTDWFVGGFGNDSLIMSLTADTLVVEQAALDANFVPGSFYSFQTFDLEIAEIENVQLQEGLGVPDMLALSGDLADRVGEADLWGLA
jgi:phospholipase/lecithinase/hemolysin